MILPNTPIEKYIYDNITYFVKREDLSCKSPGPPFAKIRGLYPHMRKLKAEGVTTVGYMDTAISMAGWGISYFAKKLKMQAVIYYPQYKDGFKYNQTVFIKKWERFGAIICPLEKPNLYQINVYRAENRFKKQYPDGVWLPNGLNLPETLESVCEESFQTFKQIQPTSIVCCVGSGVMLAGILQGLNRAMVRTKEINAVLIHRQVNIPAKRTKILNHAGFKDYMHPGFFPEYPSIGSVTNALNIIKTEYLYHEQAKMKAPFPCNTYYDLKAFEWMINNIHKLPQPILFWNIGA